MKDKLIGGLIGTASGVVVGVVMIYFNGRISNAQSIQVEIDKKLDKTAYISDQKQRWDDHNALQEEKDKRIDDMYIWIRSLYKKSLEDN